MKKFLVASDLSARSDRALARAVELANQHEACLTVLHVVDDNLPRSVLKSAIPAARDELESSIKEITHTRMAILKIQVTVGSAFREILDVAANEASDLIVLGRHRNEYGALALGGTTMGRIARMGTHPVLVVADRVERPYGTILVGVDFSVPSRCALRTSFALAPEAEYHVVHAYDVPFQGFLPGHRTLDDVRIDHDRALSRLIEMETCALGGAPNGGSARRARIEKVLARGPVESVLRCEAERLRPHLIAIGTHGRTGVARAILGSVAEDLLDRPPCDVLAVPSRMATVKADGAGQR